MAETFHAAVVGNITLRKYAGMNDFGGEVKRDHLGKGIIFVGFAWGLFQFRPFFLCPQKIELKFHYDQFLISRSHPYRVWWVFKQKY